MGFSILNTSSIRKIRRYTMLTFVLAAITVAIAVAAYFIQFPMETWVPFSIVSYGIMVIAFAVGTIIRTRKLKRENNDITYKLFGVWDKIDTAFGAVMVIFVWYVIISMISYFRLLNYVIKDGPGTICMVIIGCIVFAGLLLIGTKKRTKKKT